MKNKKLFGLTFLISGILLPTTIFLAASCVPSNDSKKVEDLPATQIQEIYNSFSLEIQENNPCTYMEFKTLFKQKYNQYNKDIRQTFLDNSIAKIIKAEIIDINNIQTGHEVLISPFFNDKTQQFGLNVKVLHIQGNYIEGKEEGNNTVATGKFKLFSEEDIKNQKQFLTSYVDKIVFKQNKDIDLNKYKELFSSKNEGEISGFIIETFNTKLKDEITFILPNETPPNSTAITFNIKIDTNINLIISLKDKIEGNILYTLTKPLTK